MTWIAPDAVRAEEPFIAGERTMLAGWLGFQPHHAAFRRHMNGEDVEYLYGRHDAPEAAFEETGPSTAADDYASLMTEWELPGWRSPAIRWTAPLSPNAAARYPCAGFASI
jgi:hypothetical protein